jgi:8-oxo-dGTP pyrophosphatase MutT (NUDIX family)
MNDLQALLGTLQPAVVERVIWPNNTVVDVAAYPVPTPVPAELVVSVRCIVRVGEHIVVCRTPGDEHVMPGGRRLPGETYETTACREVYEETGWLVDESDLRELGFLHFRHVEPQPDDHPYPHPDFLQIVYTGRAHGRDGDSSAWVDIEGWEQGHRLLTVPELDDVKLPAGQRAFVAALP